MDGNLRPDEAHPGDQLCILSCQRDGVAYYWSVIDGRSRNAVGFRGFSAKFQAAAVAREVMDFTVQGPLIVCLADLQDITQVQAIDMGGSFAAPSGPPSEVPFAVKILVAPAPQAAPHSRNPHGVILSVKNETEGTTVATVADLHRDEDWVFAILVAAIAAIAVNSGPAAIEKLMFDDSIGDINATITTPIGTVTVNKPFIAAPGLAGLDG
jgi:hypothetical protein